MNFDPFFIATISVTLPRSKPQHTSIKFKAPRQVKPPLPWAMKAHKFLLLSPEGRRACLQGQCLLHARVICEDTLCHTAQCVCLLLILIAGNEYQVRCSMHRHTRSPTINQRPRAACPLGRSALLVRGHTWYHRSRIMEFRFPINPTEQTHK